MISPLSSAPARTAASRAAMPVHAMRQTAMPDPAKTSDVQQLARRARALADAGHLTEALAYCNQWAAADKLDPAGYYLRAVILQEQGQLEQARIALQSALYLNPEFVLAHFALGCLVRRCGRPAESRRHFANARQLLRRCRPDASLPESDGLSAGRLAEILSSFAEDEIA